MALYFYRTYTATLSGSITRRETCVGCSGIFEYEIKRVVQGGGHSGFFLNNAGAEVSAQSRARDNLNRALREAIEPTPCPHCGVFQPDMVRVLRERRGAKYDPNKYALERVTVSVRDAWLTAGAENTIESYTKFMDMWPGYSEHAERQIRDLKYPPRIRKLASLLLWSLWGVLALLMLALVFAAVAGWI